MSEININHLPVSLPIRYTKSWHSFSNPHNGIQRYLFELIINPNSPNKKTFRKIENSKHSDLIEESDNINYSEIKEFKLNISKLPFDIHCNYEIEGKINNDNSYYNQTEQEIFVEFSRNSLNLAFCRSSFIGIDFNKMCVSPP